MHLTLPLRFSHFLIAAIPVLLTPAFVYALAEGVVDLGGGEKDILVAFPYLIWAMIFLVSSAILIYKRWNLVAWMVRSGIVATIVLVILGIITYFAGWLGVA